MQQQQISRTPVKRMDESAREYETAQHEETLRRARRASRKALRTSMLAQRLLTEINEAL